MQHRCNPENAKKYPRYAGRGISVCPEWQEDFWVFVRDMGDRPEGTSIDRINNNGNYEPNNCRWATHEVQSNNKDQRVYRYVEFRGEKKSLAQLAREQSVPLGTLLARLRYGWTVERAATAVVQKKTEKPLVEKPQRSAFKRLNNKELRDVLLEILADHRAAATPSRLEINEGRR
jgi:hypothetical protein